MQTQRFLERNPWVLVVVPVGLFFLFLFIQISLSSTKKSTGAISTSERLSLLVETWDWQEKRRAKVWDNHEEFAKFNNFRWVYYLWAPIPGACHMLERVGSFDDGGKFQCNLFAIRQPCVVYSFGIYSIGEDDYDLKIAERLKCQVFGFDPTVTPEVIKEYEKKVPGGKTYPWALGPVAKSQEGYSWTFEGHPVKSLGEIAKELKHTKIDILKIDIEKAEHAVIPHMLAEPGFQNLGVTQIAVELHFTNLWDMKDDFSALEKAGYYPIMNEKNYRCDTCIEYLFVHKSHLAKSPPK